MPRKSKGKSVQLSQKEYDQLRSRPKQSTLQRDSRQLAVRKGKRGNPYLQTLLDPIHVTGVKVPDVTSFPSSTFQLYNRFEVTVGATNFGVAYTPLFGSFRQLNGSLNGATNWGAWTAHPDDSALEAIYHNYRPVSGCVRAYTTASSTSNQGEIVCAILPKNQSLNSMLSADAIANRFGAFRAPLKTGVELLWMPQDPDSRTYLLKTAGASSATMSDHWPGFVFGVEGASASSIIVFEYFFNYEACPEDSTFNLVNATAPYISSKDSEEATGIITKLGTFARPYGEDLGSWLLDQGAMVGREVGQYVAGAAVHYVADRIGLSGSRHLAKTY